MKPLNKSATRTFRQLTSSIPANRQATIVDTRPRVFMAVHVDKLQTIAAGSIFALAHYYEQNGDLCADPDMTFLDAGKCGVFALTFQQANPPVYHDAVGEWTAKGEIKSYRHNLQRELTAMANTWLANIAQQQHIADCIRAINHLATDLACTPSTAAKMLDVCEEEASAES